MVQVSDQSTGSLLVVAHIALVYREAATRTFEDATGRDKCCLGLLVMNLSRDRCLNLGDGSDFRRECLRESKFHRVMSVWACRAELSHCLGGGHRVAGASIIGTSQDEGAHDRLVQVFRIRCLVFHRL